MTLFWQGLGGYILSDVSLDFMPAPVYITSTRTSRFFVIKFNCFVYDRYLPIRLRWVVKRVSSVTSGDVASGVAKCDPQSIWNPRKNCVSFVDATSSES